MAPLKDQIMVHLVTLLLEGHDVLFADVSRAVHTALAAHYPMWPGSVLGCLDMGGIPLFPRDSLAPSEVRFRFAPCQSNEPLQHLCVQVQL